MTTTITNSGFPRKRYDAMAQKAANFDPRAVEIPSKWTFSGPSHGFHKDAAETAFIVRSLEDIRAGVLEREFPKLMASSWFPITVGGVDPGAEEITFTHGNEAGVMEYTKDLKGDAPRVDFKLDQVSYKARSFWNSYGYGIQDVRSAMKAGLPLTARYASLAREQAARLHDDIAFNGHVAAKLTGMLNLTGTDTFTPAADGVGASKLWADKDADKILRDLAAPASQVITATLGIENPESMLLPISLHELIGTRRVGDGTSMSILKYFQANDPNITNVYRTHKSATSGGGGTTRVVVYEKSADKVEMVTPILFEQFAPGTSANGLEVVTVCHMRTLGIIPHRPKSICYIDGQ